MPRLPMYPADDVLEFAFPDGAVHVLGLPLGCSSEQARAALTARGGGDDWRTRREVGDGHKTRAEEVALTVERQRLLSIQASFGSQDRQEVDAGFRKIKNHLDAAVHPNRLERRGHALHYLWRVDGPVPAEISVHRFREMERELAVLKLQCRPV